MAKKDKEKKVPEAPETPETEAETPVEEAPAEAPKENWEEKYNAERDAHLRLAAEYDNFRKRSQKEKDATYANAKADTAAKLLPVYDNLSRALSQPTEDAAFKKGVELTMAELEKIFTALGITTFGEAGDTFDPNFHNAVMHMEDESKGENEITAVFQKGFKLGDKVIRFAMVQVAN